MSERMSETALVTGGTGFVGRHLCARLARAGCRVVAVHSGRLGNPEMPADVTLARCDLTDQEAVERLVRAEKPDLVFHLAAETASASFRDRPDCAWRLNIRGTTNLLHAIRLADTDPVIVVTGSSAQYGAVPETEQPITETVPCRPLSEYGVSKIAQAMLAYQSHLAFGMRIVRTTTFNCIGPGQPLAFQPAAFAAQIAAIEAGSQEPILRVGNLASLRDMTDVRDVVEAYWRLSGVGVPGEVYNVCSGVAVSGETIVRELTAMSTTRVDVVQEPSRMRRDDVPVQVGNPAKLASLASWKPEISLAKSLEDVLSDWRLAHGLR